MKLLIYGSRGWIGQKIITYLRASGTIGTTDIDFVEGNARVENTEDVAQELDSTKPSNVLCLVGRTHGSINGKEYSTIDYLEQPGKIKENVRDNLYAPISLALLCQQREIHLSYLG